MQKIKFLSDMRARIQTIPRGGGFELPIFLLGNKWQPMIFMGRPGPPALSVSALFQTVSIHILFNFFCWAWSIHKTSANYISWRQGSFFFLRSKRPRTSIPTTCCFKVWGRTWWWPWRKKMYITHYTVSQALWTSRTGFMRGSRNFCQAGGG